jgi:hypothetical protein
MLSVDEELTVLELATGIGLTLGTVRSNLKFLAAYGLAFRVDRTTWRGTPTVPDKCAPAPDGVDYNALKRERHTTERNEHRMWVNVRKLYRDRPDELEEFRSRRMTEEGWDPDEPTPVFDSMTGEILPCAHSRQTSEPAFAVWSPTVQVGVSDES